MNKLTILLLMLIPLLSTCNKDVQQPANKQDEPRSGDNDLTELQMRASEWGQENGMEVTFPTNLIQFENTLYTVSADTTHMGDSTVTVAKKIFYNVYATKRGNPSATGVEAMLNSYWDFKIENPGIMASDPPPDYLVPYGTTPFVVQTKLVDSTGGHERELNRVQYRYDPNNRSLFPVRFK